jgi:quercetin dioxygenase-like cupin family protein
MEFYKFNKNSGKKISNHQAVVPQLLLILNGEGYVRNEKDEYFKVESGDAVFWVKMNGTKLKHM